MASSIELAAEREHRVRSEGEANMQRATLAALGTALGLRDKDIERLEERMRLLQQQAEAAKQTESQLHAEVRSAVCPRRIACTPTANSLPSQLPTLASQTQSAELQGRLTAERAEVTRLAEVRFLHSCDSSVTILSHLRPFFSGAKPPFPCHSLHTSPSPCHSPHTSPSPSHHSHLSVRLSTPVVREERS